MKKEMLINVLQPEECRIAIVEDGVLEELYVERSSQESYVGNIYKGRIVNIEPSIQAAFVDFGIGRNGFLHVSDVDPVYYKHLLSKEMQEALEAEEVESGGGRPRQDRDRGGRRPPRDAGLRVTTPESAVTIPADRPQPVPAASDIVEDLAGFAEGLVEGDRLPQPVLEERKTRVFESESRQRPFRQAPERREVIQAEPIEDADFGAGLLDESADLLSAAKDGEAEEIVDLIREDLVEPGASATSRVEEPDTEGVDEKTEESKPKAKSRGRTRIKKTEDVVEGVDESETRGRSKPKRGRKKSDAETTEEGGDEAPRPMPGAERRTEEDDEPEVRPLFDGGATNDFDVDAPNDRFASSDASPVEDVDEPSELELSGFESVEESEESGSGDRVDAEIPPDNEFTPAPIGRGFNDTEDEEYEGGTRQGGRGDRGRPRGDRDRGRGRGRGPSRERDRGRGPNGGRPPARDRGFPRPPIQEIFKRGQEVIVQVIKEGIGTKGPTLSTFISIAGRYLVLMPSLNRVGVSRKIEDIDARKRLREIMNALSPPRGVGFIVRTAAIDRNETELRNDLAYLLRLWQVVVRRIKKMAGPVEIYRESDMITRTIRDIFTNDIDTIWVDEANAFAHASEFLQIVMPRFADRIRYHADTEPLFNRYRVEDEIAKINHKRIDLPQGGSLIIEQTEALVAIDVNSGTFRAENRDAEETAFRMNLQAAKEIARQLRLRDLGGVIVNDFIDMRNPDHRRRLEDAMREALKRDRARTKILRISQFGLIEMTRQRIQPSLKKRIYNDCPHCRGTGYVKTNETMGIEVMRLLQLAAHRSPAVTSVILTVHADAAFYLLNRKRKEINGLEEKAKMEVQINGQFGVSPDTLEFRCHDSNGNEVRLLGGPPPRMFRGASDRGRGNRGPVQQLD